MKELTDKEFTMIRDYIKDNYGISLGDEKRSLIYSRLRTVLQQKGFSDFTEYFKYLTSDKTGEAAILFINKITTNHTFFMRESEHFDYFKNVVLPWVEKTYPNKDLRLWCAGCSSGEEAYTLAMLVHDFFKDKPGWNTEMLATDISTKVLEMATKGIYSNESIASLPSIWQKTYFKKFDEDNMIASDVLKEKITFRKFNLMEEHFPFKKPFQVIFCRNVMIYFDNETRDKLVARFCRATDKDGYFFIGHSESLNNITTDYKYLTPATYRKS